jgi:hypothetical protein
MDGVRRHRRAGLAVGLAAATASVVAFAIVNSASPNSNEVARNSAPTPTLRFLKEHARTLDRPRGPHDVLPPKVAELLASLPGTAPGAADQSMQVMAVDAVGAVYVAPLTSGFAILSTVGFGGTVPDGLSRSNPLVGGTATLQDGRLVLLGVGSDDVVGVDVMAGGAHYAAHRVGNGFWWVSPTPALDSDEIAISTRMKSGRVQRLR